MLLSSTLMSPDQMHSWSWSHPATGACGHT